MSTDQPSPRPVPLTTADGYGLTALHYPAVGAAQARLFVAGATGVAQRFYAPFANFAASQASTSGRSTTAGLACRARRICAAAG